MAWRSDTGADLNKKTYLDGFLDISGKLIMRNNDISLNGNLRINGDVSMNGILDVTRIQNTQTINNVVNNYQLIITDDLSLNGRLFLAGGLQIGTNYNVPAGMTHSMRVNNTEVVSVSAGTLSMNSASIYMGGNVLYMNPATTAYLYTPTGNITYLFNEIATNGRIQIRAGGGAAKLLTVTPDGLENTGTINATYSALPTLATNSIGYLYWTSVTNTQAINGSNGTKNIATIASLPIGVWAITYQVNFTAFSPVSQRIKTHVGTTTTAADVAGILMTQVSVNDYQGCCSTIYYNNGSVKSIYLNVSLNPGVSCQTYTEASNSSYFQAIRIA